MTTIGTRHALVPNWVYDRVPDAAALRIYIHLAGEYCNKQRGCFPKETRLAEDLGYSTRTIERALANLRDADALAVRRSRKTSGHWGHNSYYLPIDDPREPDTHHQPPPQAGGADQHEHDEDCSGSELTRTTYAQVPRWVYRRVTHAPTLRLYTRLRGKYCDVDRHCFPKETELAEDLGYSLSTVERGFRTLRDADAVLVDRSSRKAGGHWRANSYTLPTDDPRQSAMDNPSQVADGADQAKRDVFGGGGLVDNPSVVAAGNPSVVAGREPDPLKQPDPGFEPDPSSPRSTHCDVDTSPSARGAEGAEFEPDDESGEDLNPSSSRRGVEPQTRQEEEGDQAQHQFTTSPAVGTQDSPPAAAGSPPDPRFPNLTEDDLANIDEIMDWLESPDYERLERLKDLVDREVGGYEGSHEEHVAEAMLERGEHWRKVVNTLLKQRDLGYVS